ncbi:MAG: NAD(P)/FAD-dependent oxidoreductase [Patescibacteria group bacterium]|nr:NAD(P)/FAD-dependent oxidoreductase [Patescibacteria group bacterium]
MEKKYKYLIIGGGIAGTSAAETIRQNDPKGTLAIISTEPHLLYSRVMLSKPGFYTSKNASGSAFLKQPSWYSANQIDFLGSRTVIALDILKKQVALKNGVVLGYEKLLLATGVQPRSLPNLESVDAERILYLHTLDQAREIERRLISSETIVVVGGGFIGFEMCGLLTALHKKVISVNIGPRYWRSVFDETSSQFIKNALTEHGVQVFAESVIKKLIGVNHVEGAIISNTETGAETKISCSLAIAAIGTHQTLDWVGQAGVKTNKGILANEYMETSARDVWAAGDCAEYFDTILEEPIVLKNWASAKTTGSIAAFGMLDKRVAHRKTTSYTTRKLGITVGFVGDVRPHGKNRTTISRGSLKANAYAELRIANERIVGATLINMNNKLGALTTLIENKISVGGRLKELSNPAFDLKKLL